MRGHVQRVRRPGSQLCVISRCRQSEVGELRVIETVNDVMRDAGMLRFERKNPIQDLSRFFLIRVCLVLRIGDSEKCEGMEDRGLVIIRVRRRNRVHRFFIRHHARVVIELVGVGVIRIDGIDVRALAIRFRACFFRSLRRVESSFQFARRWRRPNGMQIRHGHAPPRHSALRIGIGRSSE